MDEKKIEMSKEVLAEVLGEHAYLVERYALIGRDIEEAKTNITKAEEELKDLDERLLILMKKITGA